MSKNNSYSGFVKSVLSGDSLIICIPPNNSPPKDFLCTLSGLRTPRLATVNPKTPDVIGEEEPFAFECREKLREFCLGKKVDFTIQGTANNSRNFCTVKVHTKNGVKDLHEFVILVRFLFFIFRMGSQNTNLVTLSIKQRQLLSMGMTKFVQKRF